MDSSPWTVASGFVTTTLKVKRNQIEEVYGTLFDAWTAHGSDVVWLLDMVSNQRSKD